MPINSKIISFEKGETGATGIPYDLFNKPITDGGTTRQKLVLYPTFNTLTLSFDYINNSLDPIDNWITPTNYLYIVLKGAHTLGIPPNTVSWPMDASYRSNTGLIAGSKRVPYGYGENQFIIIFPPPESLDRLENDVFIKEWTSVSDMEKSGVTENWESEVLSKIGVSFVSVPKPSLPTYYKKFNATYYYGLQNIPGKFNSGAEYEKELPETESAQPWADPANASALMGLMGNAESNIWPHRGTQGEMARMAYVAYINTYTDAKAEIARCGNIYRVLPPDPQYTDGTFDLQVIDKSFPSSLGGDETLGFGTGYELIDLDMPFDPHTWADPLSSSLTGQKKIKNYFWINCYVNKTPWNPTTYEWEPRRVTTAYPDGTPCPPWYSYYTQERLAEVKKNAMYINNRYVTLEYFLTPKYDQTTKVLCWYLYIMEYEQGTTNLLKGWMATKYSLMSKWVSAEGTYTVRHMYDSKTGKSQDITNNSNLVITIDNASNHVYGYPVYHPGG